MPTQTLTVRVTQKHIQNGIPESLCSCPIAKAIRPFARKQRVEVDGIEATIGNYWGGKGSLYQLPRVAQEFISAFDQGKKVKPITFTLKEIK